MQDFDDQKPSLKDIVQPEDISNAPTENLQKLKVYQDAAKKLSPRVGTEYNEVEKRRVISKFAVKSIEKAVHGTEKLKIDTLIVAKKFKFSMDLQDHAQSKNVYLESVRAIDYNSDDVDQHLVYEGVQFKSRSGHKVDRDLPVDRQNILG
ncbi:UNVERIFIED_CONTAM: hypothetical protein NCL1_16828 [Trichonephila clavipes]